jgi:hypothetical protein
VTQARIGWLVLVAALALAALGSHEARAAEWTRADYNAYRRAARSTWHGAYYNTQTGRPTAVVVPPTAHMQSSYNWGVAQTRSTPIYHQYGRAYPGVAAPAGLPFAPTPRWPSSTNQHGYYYVRGPW